MATTPPGTPPPHVLRVAVAVLRDFLLASLLVCAPIGFGYYMSRGWPLYPYATDRLCVDAFASDGLISPTPRWFVFMIIQLQAVVCVLRSKKNVLRGRKSASIATAFFGTCLAMVVLASLSLPPKATVMVDVPIHHGACISDPFGPDNSTKVSEEMRRSEGGKGEGIKGEGVTLRQRSKP